MKRSLFIIALPRSGSTALQVACQMMLRPCKCKGELLNNRTYTKCKFKYHAKPKHYDAIQASLKPFRHDHIVRDVIQTEFVTARIDWIREHFNVLYLVRPFNEIKICCGIKGWAVPSKKLRKGLDGIEEGEYFQRLAYDSFIFKIKPLHDLLEQWYNIWPYDYLSPAFIRKRGQTLQKMKKHGQRR